MNDHLQDIKNSFSDLGIELNVGIEESNIGACTGEWIVADDMHELVSNNPTDGQPIASIIQADEAAYEQVVAAACRYGTEAGWGRRDRRPCRRSDDVVCVLSQTTWPTF